MKVHPAYRLMQYIGYTSDKGIRYQFKLKQTT